MANGSKPHTQEMVVIHRVFRREFHLLPDLIGAVAVGNTGRVIPAPVKVIWKVAGRRAYAGYVRVIREHAA